MPFLLDYECGNGHRFEHMADSRDTAPPWLVCRTCAPNWSEKDSTEAHTWLLPAPPDPPAVEPLPGATNAFMLYPERRKEHVGADQQYCIARPVISMASAPVTIVKGNGDFAVREKERLHKRSVEAGQTRGVVDESRHLAEVQLQKVGVPLQTIRDHKMWGV